MSQSRSRRKARPKAWSDDAVTPVSRNVGHRWTSEEARAIALGRGGRKRARRYRNLVARDGMTYTQIWAANAARTRWNKVRLKRGLAPVPLIDVGLIDSERANVMRERRELERRRREYDQAQRERG